MAKKVKQKIEKVDGGLDADLVKKLRSAIRLVWQRSSHARKLVVNRCKSFEGEFSFCELCNAKVGKIYVDHIKNIGDVDDGFIKRMFVSSKEMQGLCKKCHDKKTAEERKLAKKLAADKERNAPPEHLYFNCAGNVAVPKKLLKQLKSEPLPFQLKVIKNFTEINKKTKKKKAP